MILVVGLVVVVEDLVVALGSLYLQFLQARNNSCSPANLNRSSLASCFVFAASL